GTRGLALPTRGTGRRHTLSRAAASVRLRGETGARFAVWHSGRRTATQVSGWLDGSLEQLRPPARIPNFAGRGLPPCRLNVGERIHLCWSIFECRSRIPVTKNTTS